MKLEYYIDMDERGEFRADVRNDNGDTVFEFNEEIFVDGFMEHKEDLDGLAKHLVSLSIMTENDRLVKGN